MIFEKTIGFRIFFWTIIIFLGIFTFFPLVWMINTALKSGNTMYDLSFLPEGIYYNNFVDNLTNKSFQKYIFNGLFVGISTAILSTVIAALAGYSFSKYRYRGRKISMVAIMISQAFPQGLLLLSLYPIMEKLHILDKHFTIIICYVALTLPVGAWTLKSYFDGVPNEIIESAKIDGASTIRIMGNIVFPLAIPGMVSIAIYSFVWSWNDLLYSLTLLSSTDKRTLASGMILTFTGEGGNNWLGMMSGSLIAVFPVAVMFIFLQKYFIAGLTSGAVKG